jgi:CRISPR/Cas system-associated endonuclease Cas1
MPPILTDLPSWVQMVVALLSGSLLTQLLQRFWLSRKEETDVAHQLREEMRVALKETSDRLDRMQRELDDWRAKYFNLLEEHTTLKIENRTLRAELDLINPKPALYTRELPPQPAAS